MSHSGLSERIGFLRRRLAALEGRDASIRPAASETGASFFAAARAGLSEVCPARPPDAPAAAAFALALALQARAARGRGALVCIVEDFCAQEFGLPYGRGLLQAGLDLSRFALVRVRRPRESLWAMEEALKSPACAAVVAETLLTPRLYGLAASRRLRLAARRGGGLGVLAALSPQAGGFSSAADLRVEVAAAAPDPPVGAQGGAARRPPLSPRAPFRWRLRLAKARAGQWGEIDPALWRDIVFDPEKAKFDHAFPERFPAEARDRPAAAPPQRRRA